MTRIHGNVPVTEYISYDETGVHIEPNWTLSDQSIQTWHVAYVNMAAGWAQGEVFARLDACFTWPAPGYAQYLALDLGLSVPAPVNFTQFGRTAQNDRGDFFYGDMPLFARWTISGATNIQLVMRSNVAGGGVNVNLVRLFGSVRAFPV